MYSREAKTDLPTNTADLETVYTTIEEGEVYLRDQRYVGITGDSSKYLLHLFKKTNDNREDDIQVFVVVKSTLAASNKPVMLQIWNGTTNAWDTIDSNVKNIANDDFSLSALIDSDEYSYYDFGNQVSIRCYQQNDTGNNTLSVDQVIISFIAKFREVFQATGNQFSEVFTETGNNFSEVYPEVTTSYSQVYPHKNPQDDL